jgi:hypothetical protein
MANRAVRPEAQAGKAIRHRNRLPHNDLQTTPAISQSGSELDSETDASVRVPMTTSWQAELEEIQRLQNSFKAVEAEQRMRRLLDDLIQEHLIAAEAEIRTVVGTFLPKRKRALTETLERKLAGPTLRDEARPIHPVKTELSPAARRAHEQHSRTLCQEIKSRLDELRDRYIFQWSTWYRDLVSDVFDETLPHLLACPDDEVLENSLRDVFWSHAQDIFPKGYEYKTRELRMKPDDALAISLHGLTRFLDLPIAAYVSRGASADHSLDGRASRRLCSAALTGIIQGYGQSSIGDKEGSYLLPRFPASWAHCLAFLTPRHLDQIVNQIEPGDLKAGLHEVVLPVIEAVDKLAEHPIGGRTVLPRLGQYSREARRLEIALELPWPVEGHRYIDIHCYPFRREVTRPRLLESASRAARLIVLELSPDLQEWAAGHDWLRQAIIDAANDPAAVAKRAFDVLKMTLASLAGPGTVNAPLTHNFARDFPLNKPGLQRYFHVPRTSVRELLRSFEHGTGIRLWCSVRRSGKTTAGFDLSSSTGTASVVAQTCEPIGERPGEDWFIELVKKALDSRRRLPRDFVQRTMDELADNRSGKEKKIIFVLDEYETLFNEMRLALDRDYETAREYTVKPLLNQLVEFSRENLVLLIGMQPNAHNILMDQNQLSPLIVLDEFPLFEHREHGGTSEFAALVRRVVGDYLLISPSFFTPLHAETGGHPFLTVNLLVDLFDWLRDRRFSAAGLELDQKKYEAYAADRLTPEAIRICGEYDFFRDFLADAIGDQVRRRQPWLHTVCTTVLRIAQAFPESFCCPRGQFADLVKGLRLPPGLHHPDDVLRTAQQANFLVADGAVVRPRIPLMGRILLSTRPDVRA